MPKITNSITIDRAPDGVWAVLRDLERVDRWAPGIADVRMDGMTRICTLPDGNGEIHEDLSVSDEQRSLTYVQTEHPLPLALSRGTLNVEPDGSGSRVTWNAEVEFTDPALEAQFLELLEHGYGAALESLKSTIEASQSA